MRRDGTFSKSCLGRIHFLKKIHAALVFVTDLAALPIPRRGLRLLQRVAGRLPVAPVDVGDLAS